MASWHTRYKARNQKETEFLGRILFVYCATEAAQLAGSNHSHTEQDRALCVLERALPTELLRQLSWLGIISHTEQDRALYVLERVLPTQLPSVSTGLITTMVFQVKTCYRATKVSHQ